VTTAPERVGAADPWPDRGRLASAPWPYVERRRTPREALELPAQRVIAPRAESDPAPASVAPPRAAWRRRAAATVVVTDVLAGALAGLVAYVTRFPSPTPVESRYLLGVLLAPLLFTAAIGLSRGYSIRFLDSGSDELRLVLRATIGVSFLAGLVSYALRAELPRGYLLLVCCTFGALSVLSRCGLRGVLHRLRRRGHWLHDVLLVGDDDLVVDLVGQIRREKDGGLRVVGVCVPGGCSTSAEELGVPVLGDLHAVPAVVRRLAVDTVAVASCTEMRGPALRRLSWDLEGTGVDLVVAPGLVEVAGPRLHIRPLCGLPLLHVEQPDLGGGRHLVKTAMDRVGSLLALLLLSPLLLGIAVAVKATSSGPVLFAQTRVGRGGRQFQMLKYRSMQCDAEQRLPELTTQNRHGDEVLFKIPRDPRVTPVGRWLRRFSLDELPQLINVLRGNMSLVGPRPPLPGEVARYGRDVHRRLLVRPGLTGLWQINGRSDLSWDESIRLDLRYVENWSLSMDLLILWRTLAAVLTGQGAY
jgi:exopolysaccharide biosynthesis polyprenyl glycosylphosphotransferase